MQHLLFAPFNKQQKTSKEQESKDKLTREVKKKIIEKSNFAINEDPLNKLQETALKEEEEKSSITQSWEVPRVRYFDVENVDQIIEEGKSRPLKKSKMKITGLGFPPVDYTPAGLPTADMAAISKLAGDPAEGRFGIAYKHLALKRGDTKGAERACFALSNWVQLKQIETLLNTFIVPL